MAPIAVVSTVQPPPNLTFSKGITTFFGELKIDNKNGLLNAGSLQFTSNSTISGYALNINKKSDNTSALTIDNLGRINTNGTVTTSSSLNSGSLNTNSINVYTKGTSLTGSPNLTISDTGDLTTNGTIYAKKLSIGSASFTTIISDGSASFADNNAKIASDGHFETNFSNYNISQDLRNSHATMGNLTTTSATSKYLTTQNYVNANGLSSNDYFVETGVTFGSNNNLHMVTLISNNASFDLYSQNENGSLAHTYKNRDIKVLIYNGSSWKHSSYKSDVVKYANALSGVSWLFPTYSTTAFYPIYNNDSIITFAIQRGLMYNPIEDGTLNFTSYKISNGSISEAYTLFIQNFHDSAFFRFTMSSFNSDFSPPNPFNNYKIMSPYTSSMYQYLIPINNFVSYGRTVPVYYFDYNNTVDTSLVAKGKFMVSLNWGSNYRPYCMVIRAYDSDGTTSINIDNLTFTNVALVNNTIEFTSSTGDKYVNMSTDPYPVASAGSYYRIKKVAPA